MNVERKRRGVLVGILVVLLAGLGLSAACRGRAAGDRSDPRVVAKQALDAYRARNWDKVIALMVPEAREYKQGLPGLLASSMTGKRKAALDAWNGSTPKEARYYVVGPSDAPAGAYVPFHTAADGEIAVVVLMLHDGAWRFISVSNASAATLAMFKPSLEEARRAPFKAKP